MIWEGIKATFEESIHVQSARALPDVTTQAAQDMVSRLLNGHKISYYSNGGYAVNAQQFSSCLVNRFDTERPRLLAIT